MLILYYTLSNGSCRKAKDWLKEHNIEFLEKRKQDLLTALTLSENSFYDLLKRRKQCTTHVKETIDHILSASFNEGLSFILDHPEMLRVPLIIGKNKIVIGYNSNEIRTFISRNHQDLELL